MDSTIIASLIGAAAATLAAVISPIVSKRLEKRKKDKFTPKAPLDRKLALNCSWNGYFDQKIGKPKFIRKHTAKIEFSFDQIEISGKLEVFFGEVEQKYIAQIVNIIFDGKLLKADYVNKNSNVTHFGTLYGELSANGNIIVGEFLGYGIESEMFVSGDIYLERAKDT